MNTIVVDTFRAFFSFKNFSLASNETCCSAICFACRRLSRYTITVEKIMNTKIAPTKADVMRLNTLWSIYNKTCAVAVIIHAAVEAINTRVMVKTLL